MLAANVMGSGESSAPVGQQEYTTSGTYTFTVPAGVTSISLVAIGSGASCDTNVNNFGAAYGAGGAGGVCYKNNVTVTPGATYTVVVGNGVYTQSSGTGAAGQATTVTGTGIAMSAGGGSITSRSAASTGGDVNLYGGIGQYNSTANSNTTFVCASRGRPSITTSESLTARPVATGGYGSGNSALVNSISYSNTYIPNPATAQVLYGSTGAAGLYGLGGSVLAPANNNNPPGRADGVSGAVRIIWGAGRSYPSNAI